MQHNPCNIAKFGSFESPYSKIIDIIWYKLYHTIYIKYWGRILSPLKSFFQSLTVIIAVETEPSTKLTSIWPISIFNTCISNLTLFSQTDWYNIIFAIVMPWSLMMLFWGTDRSDFDELEQDEFRIN